MPIANSPLGRRVRVREEPTDTAAQAMRQALSAFSAPLFRRIVESSASCVMVIDAAGDDQPILYASPALQQLMGCGAPALLGTDWGQLFQPRHADSPPQVLRAAVRRGFAAREILGARHSDGTPLCVDARFAPLSDDMERSRLRVAFLHDVTTECSAREALEYRAGHDPLTGLANRYLLQDHFERASFQAQRHGTGFTVVLLDLDHFKYINDRYGHAAGDEILRTAGMRLKALVRGEDTVARWGGDEFVLLLADTAGQMEAQGALVRIRESLARSDGPAADSPGFSVCCSVGAARYPDDGATLQALLQTADERLYADKGAPSPGVLRLHRAAEAPGGPPA